APHAQNQPAPRRTPDPVPDLKDPFSDDNQRDPFAMPHGIPALNTTFTIQLVSHLCTRLTQCGMADEPTAQLMCTAMRARGRGAAAPTCDAQRRCLEHIDQMSCSMQSTDPSALMSLIGQFQDCTDAVSC